MSQTFATGSHHPDAGPLPHRVVAYAVPDASVLPPLRHFARKTPRSSSFLSRLGFP
jgi:hypothetical protein